MCDKCETAATKISNQIKYTHICLLLFARAHQHRRRRRRRRRHPYSVHSTSLHCVRFQGLTAQMKWNERRRATEKQHTLSFVLQPRCRSLLHYKLSVCSRGFYYLLFLSLKFHWTTHILEINGPEMSTNSYIRQYFSQIFEDRLNTREKTIYFLFHFAIRISFFSSFFFFWYTAAHSRKRNDSTL